MAGEKACITLHKILENWGIYEWFLYGGEFDLTCILNRNMNKDICNCYFKQNVTGVLIPELSHKDFKILDLTDSHNRADNIILGMIVWVFGTQLNI